ncbi:hypothetical protein GJ700_12230, partial [Duganella sp. FT92W]|nr:hypothetical protein [Pseudoduganella rivuli]
MTASADSFAFHNEQVAARRLARAQGIPVADALQAVLAQAAALAGLADVPALLA